MRRIAFFAAVVLASSSCEDVDRYSLEDGGLELVRVSLASTGAFRCGTPAVNADETPLLASSGGSFRYSVEVRAPELVDGDLRAEIVVVASGTSMRPMDTILLLRDGDGMYRGSTTLSVPGASRVVVRTRVAGRERDDVGVFVSSDLRVALRAEPRTGTERSFDAIATVTCAGVDFDAGTGETPDAGPATARVSGVTVTFTAGPDVTLASTTARTNSDGEATVLATRAEADGEVVLRASSGSAAESCVMSDRTCP